MVLMLVLGWLGMKVKQARNQREAANAIEKLGGSVGWPPSGGMVRTAVAWVGKLFGEDLPGDVTSVVLRGTQVSDAGLAHLRGLTQLWHLDLNKTQVTDAGAGSAQRRVPAHQLQRRREGRSRNCLPARVGQLQCQLSSVGCCAVSLHLG